MKKIVIEVSEKNEGTWCPWWAILDPHQFFRATKEGIYDLASMVTGPYFSREEAQEQLDRRRYDYGPHACVFCFTGCHSGQYQQRLKETKSEEM